MEKRRNNVFSFPQYFQYIFQNISNFRSQITYPFVKCGCPIYFFLNSANLICRGTDISKYLTESFGLRDNENRLYIVAEHDKYPVISRKCLWGTFINGNLSLFISISDIYLNFDDLDTLTLYLSKLIQAYSTQIEYILVLMEKGFIQR